MSEEELNHFCTKLYKDTIAMKTRFDNLVFTLKQAVKSYPVTDIASLLKSHEKHFERPLRQCASISEVFDNAASLWSFYNYDIVKILIIRHGTKSDKEHLEKYEEEFREYSKRRICECPKDAFGVQKKSEKCFALKTDKNMNYFTLEQLNDLQFEMNKILGRKFLRLLRIEDGCVRLIFRSLSDDMMDLSTEQQMKLRLLGVLKISYGDRSMDMPELKISYEKRSMEMTELKVYVTTINSEFHNRYNY